MFDQRSFELRINNLFLTGHERQAEQELLNACAELRNTGDIETLRSVINELAHFYARPMTEDLAKAEGYFLEGEILSPEPHTLLQTATFYFYSRRDFPKTVAKVDEIKSRWDVTRSASYYSALTLKGEALIELGDMDGAKHVLVEILAMINLPPARLPYGDEMNFMGAAISKPVLAQRSREILRLIIPRIRAPEYVQRAKSLLEEEPGTEGT